MAIVRYKVKGLQETTRNLRREIAGIKESTREGLLQAGLFVEGEAIPITPHSGPNGGTLRNRFFVDVTAPGVTPAVVRIGNTAEHAAAVHEMPESYNYTTPGTGPKFLQRTLSENVREILATIRAYASRRSAGRAR